MLRNHVSEAEDAGDKDKAQQLRKEISDLHRSKENTEHLIYQLTDVLSREQHIQLYNHITERSEWEPANKIDAIVASTDLPAKQINKINALTRQYRIDIAAFNAEHIDELVQHRINAASSDKQVAQEARTAASKLRQSGPTQQYLRDVAQTYPPSQRRAFWDAYKNRARPQKS